MKNALVMVDSEFVDSIREHLPEHILPLWELWLAQLRELRNDLMIATSHLERAVLRMNFDNK